MVQIFAIDSFEYSIGLVKVVPVIRDAAPNFVGLCVGSRWTRIMLNFKSSEADPRFPGNHARYERREQSFTSSLVVSIGMHLSSHAAIRVIAVHVDHASARGTVVRTNIREFV